LDDDKIELLLGLNQTSKTGNLWPTNLKGLNEGLKLHIITVQSSELDITC